MRLSIKNLGKIFSADIEIDGITVIAGENNTGKSTVGKTLFCIFNSFNNISDRIKNEKFLSVSRALESAYINYSSRLTASRFEEISDLAELILEKLATPENKELYTQKDMLDAIIRNSALLREHIEAIDMEDTVDYILEIANISDNEALLTILFNRMQVDFGMQLNNIRYPDVSSEILLEIKDIDIQISILDNGPIDLSGGISLNTEAIYIDSPFAFDNLRVTPARPRSYRSHYLSHREHLRSCLTRDETLSSIDEITAARKLGNVLEKINSVCAGEIVKKSPRSFAYREGNSDVALDIVNMSTGLKTFAIIKTLLLNGSIEYNGTIILDEPEIHLHPEWQLVFAELIVLLQKEFNMHILLTTHSPYFLEAIEVYSLKHDIVNKCKYYLSENSGESANIMDVTNNLELIYAKLARPLQVLENERYI